MEPTENTTIGLDVDARAKVSARWGFDVPPFASITTIGSTVGPTAGPIVQDRFFFPSYQHLRALGFVGQLLWSRASLAAIVSEEGMGKTMLIQRLRADLDPRVLIAHVQANSEQDPQEFLLDVLHQFGMKLEANDRNDRRRLLNRYFNHQSSLNRLCLLVVEGVHTMRPAVLDELREVAAMTIDGQRVLKLLLLGSPVLQHIIDAPRMAGICEGKAPRLTLDCFSEDQVAAYVGHRLRAAGAEDPDACIPPTLMTAIHRYSGGRPRIVNRLCEQALTLATKRNDRFVTQQTLDQAAEYLGFRPTGTSQQPATPSNADITTLAAAQSEENAMLVPEPALLVLSIQGGPDGVVPLLSNRILIGRGETVDLRVESGFVSRYHALLVRESGADANGTPMQRDILIDLGSTNGIVVNGKRRVRHILKHRDLIQVGLARITYLNPMQAPAQEGDSSETLSFNRIANESEAGHAIVGFGHMDEVG